MDLVLPLLLRLERLLQRLPVEGVRAPVSSLCVCVFVCVCVCCVCVYTLSLSLSRSLSLSPALKAVTHGNGLGFLWFGGIELQRLLLHGLDHQAGVFKQRALPYAIALLLLKCLAPCVPSSVCVCVCVCVCVACLCVYSLSPHFRFRI